MYAPTRLRYVLNQEILNVIKFMQVHSVRGQSGFYNLALTERNMQIRFDLKLSAYSLGVEI